MKTVKILSLMFLTSLFTLACNEEAGRDEEADTVIIREKEEVNTPVEKEDENSINFKIESDKDGKVSGGVEGDVELDKDNK